MGLKSTRPAGQALPAPQAEPSVCQLGPYLQKALRSTSFTDAQSPFSLPSLPKPLYFSTLRGKSIERRDTPLTPLVLAATGTQMALTATNHWELAHTEACFYVSAVPAQNAPKTNSAWLTGFEFAPLSHHTVMDIINDTFLLF